MSSVITLLRAIISFVAFCHTRSMGAAHALVRALESFMGEQEAMEEMDRYMDEMEASQHVLEPEQHYTGF